MVSRRTNFGERSEPAPDRGGKLQSAGGRHKVTFRHCIDLMSIVHMTKLRLKLQKHFERGRLGGEGCSVISDTPGQGGGGS